MPVHESHVQTTAGLDCGHKMIADSGAQQSCGSTAAIQDEMEDAMVELT